MDFLQIFNLTAGELIGVFTAAYALCAMGLAMHFGYTGLLNFGQAGFAALGAYGYAFAALHLGWNMWGSLAFGILLAVAFAIILGIPTLRLRADYLAIVTIAAAQALYYAFGTQQYAGFTGGSNGLSEFGGDFYKYNPIPVGTYNLGIISLSEKEVWIRVVAWGLVALVAVFMTLLTRSPWGRTLKGIREDEDAVRSLGKNVFVYKMQSLILGGVIGALGGMVFVISSQTNQASTWVSNFTFMTWTVLLLGGATTILGPVVGSATFFMFLMFVQQLLQGLVNIGALPFLSIAQVGQIRYLLVGLFLMLLVIFRPQGFFGNKKEMQFNG
ncbi:MAG: branched-chain amino acid ABC transporter permease [Micrococcales bacterium]